MKLKEFLSVLNMQVKYKVVDRNTRTEIYNNYNYKELTKEDIKELKNRNIYMIYGDDNILDIRVY